MNILRLPIINQRILILGCFLCLIIFGFFTCCVNDNEEKMNEANSLLESADERINSLDYENDDVNIINYKLSGADVDINEAIKIIDEIEPTSDEEKNELIAMKTSLNVASIIIDMIRTDFIDVKTHLQNAANYKNNNNWASWKIEIELAIENLENASDKLKIAQYELNKVNINDLPADWKGDVTEFKMVIDDFEIEFDAMIDQLNEGLQNVDSNAGSIYYISNTNYQPTPPAKNWHTVVDETTQIKKDYYTSWEWKLKKGDTFSISISTDGAALDLLIMDQVNFFKYKGDRIVSFMAWSELNTINVKYSFVAIKDNTYYFVLDNTIQPEDGAYAGRNMNVNVQIDQYY